MLTREDLSAMMAAEEKRLGVGSEEFLKRHQEIMDLIEQAKQEGECKNDKAVSDR